jgi:prepilin-type N-terminal cleavage/methylation domain-containing protein
MKDAFTLVELLVVIAIITVLAGMLLTVIWLAKGKGRAAVCSNNMRQFGVGCELYKGDNNEMLPGKLTALFPGYCDNNKLFLCPADMSKGKEGGKPDIVDNEDWEHETDEDGCSYFYEFSSVICGWDYTTYLDATVEEITGDSEATDATWNQVKYYQLRNGDTYNDKNPYPPDRFPIVRCFWHTINPDADKEKIILNLSFSGRVFESGPKWEETASK